MRKEELPVYKYKDEIIKSISENQVTVIEAPTGSGKTTQIPQILFNSGLLSWGMIGITQPRRIAAFSVSNRIAYEMKTELGRLVGYKVRFTDKTSEDTQIKIMTDGILLEELRSDPMLSKYSIIMVDEAHERSLNIDFILGLLKDILEKRADLKVVVSSATINAKLFSEFFNNAPILSIDARQFPVKVNFMPLLKNNDTELVLTKIIEIVALLEKKKEKGDVLIFLEGEASIKECCERLEVLNANNNMSMAILPLYARLSSEEQNRVFDEFLGKRKIVVATNIAETSITIDGIVFVIDPGVAKLNYYNPRTFTSFLEAKPISKASCDQRKGRAGRTAAGVIYRLYSEKDYMGRDQYTKEEIFRTDLSEVVLRMADLGISDYFDFNFIAPPRKGAILSAIETLVMINALDENQHLTEIGKKMVDFPLEPRLSRILLETLLKYPRVTYDVLIVISFLSTKTPFLYPHGQEIESRAAQKKLLDKSGDFFSWINLFHKYVLEKDKEGFCKKFFLDIKCMNEILNIHAQLSDMLRERNCEINDEFDYKDIIKCVCAGLKQYICLRVRKGRITYNSPTEHEIRIHPGSLMFGENPEWLIGGEIVNTGRTYIRSAAVVPEEIIKTNFPDVYRSITKKEFRVKESIRQEETKVKEKIIESNRIYILDKYFDIKSDRRGKFALIPYQVIIQLKKQKEKILHYDFGKLDARLVFKDKIILTDKLNSLLKYFDKINLESGINLKWPKNEEMLYPEDWGFIFKYIKLLLVPTLTRKKSERAGFLSVDKTGDDSFRFYLEYDFFYAIETSLTALEDIFSKEIQVWNEKEKIELERVHHRLIALSEEMEI